MEFQSLRRASKRYGGWGAEKINSRGQLNEIFLGGPKFRGELKFKGAAGIPKETMGGFPPSFNPKP